MITSRLLTSSITCCIKFTYKRAWDRPLSARLVPSRVCISRACTDRVNSQLVLVQYVLVDGMGVQCLPLFRACHWYADHGVVNTFGPMSGQIQIKQWTYALDQMTNGGLCSTSLYRTLRYSVSQSSGLLKCHSICLGRSRLG